MNYENNRYFNIHELTEICGVGDDKSFKTKRSNIILNLGYSIDEFKIKNEKKISNTATRSSYYDCHVFIGWSN